MHEFLSSRDAVTYIGRSDFTLRWWRAQGMGPPYYRQNRSISYSRADLDAYLEERRVDGAALRREPAPQPDPRHRRRRPKAITTRRRPRRRGR
jgi:hypothetical protein